MIRLKNAPFDEDYHKDAQNQIHFIQIIITDLFNVSLKFGETVD
jgi:hypothetical protein